MDKISPRNLTSIANDGLGQVPKLLPLMLLAYIPILLGLAVLIIVYLVADIPLRIFFIDPVSEFNAPMYVGSVSNFGVVCWCVAASTCLFGGWLIFRSNARETAWFLIAAGLVSTLLTLDDLYLLHEELLPDHFFIPQKLVFAAYVGLILTFLIRFRQMILSTDFVLLAVAFAFLAASAFVDLFIHPEEFVIFGSFPGRHLIEDGFKLFGIVTWSIYFVRTSFQKVSPLIRTI